MDLDLVQRELDVVDEAYKRNLQEDVAHKLRDKPVFNNVSDMLDWKSELFSFQYNKDKRFHRLFDDYLTNDEVENFFDTVVLNPYFENVPFFKQSLLLLSRGDVLYGGARGGGKALALDTPVVTSEGFKTVEEVMVGDTVYDLNGKPCHVTSKSDVFFDHKCYEILFDDGCRVVCDEEHKWTASNTNTRKHHGGVTRTFKTKDMVEHIIGYNEKNNYAIPCCKPVQYETKDLPIDPYLFGVWLIYGDFDGGLSMFDIPEKVNLDGFIHEYTYYWRSPKLKEALEDLDLIDDKFIPECYLKSSVSQRLELYRGYMDNVSFKSRDKGYRLKFKYNERLALNFCELISSIGLKPTVNHDGNNFMVYFVDDKIDLKANGKGKGDARFIIDIHEVDSVPCQCIGVDSGTHQFLITDSYLATHNSDSALMSALQYVEFPEWTVGIFRLTYKDLTTPGAILNRAESWLVNNRLLDKEGIAPDYKKTGYKFIFPSGSQIQFAQVQFDQDAQHFQGAELHKTIIDEAVQFTETKINRLRASIRKNIDDPLPTEILFTGNPGGVSTEYFRNNFVEGDGQFIDSTYIDNCYLDFKDYEERVFEKLKDSDPVLYAQWKLGDWTASNSGSMFKQEWFKTYTHIDEKIISRVRSWDMASTDPVDPTSGGDPDYCVGSLIMKGESGRIYVDNMVRFREDPDEVEEDILNIARQDGRDTVIVMEQEGGSQAKTYMSYLQRKLQGYHFEALSSRKDKTERAKPMVSAIKFGNMKFREGEEWYYDMLNELCSYPTVGVHDDQVDSLSLGFNYVNGIGEKPMVGQVVDNDMFIRLNERV